MQVSDGGSNEVGSRNTWLFLLHLLPFVYYLDSDCFEHGVHLMVLGGLLLVDKHLAGHRRWKYYSSLAIFANVARDVAADLFERWEGVHGSTSAREFVRKLFPKANSARWGAVHGLELRLRAAGLQRLHSVLLFVLCQKLIQQSNNQTKKAAATASMNPNTLAVEQTKEYTQLYGKWRVHALETSRDPLLSALVDVMVKARGPLMHLSNFIKTRIPEAERRSFGNHLAQIVNFKAEEIDLELDDLFGNLVIGFTTNFVFFRGGGKLQEQLSRTIRNFRCVQCNWVEAITTSGKVSVLRSMTLMQIG